MAQKRDRKAAQEDCAQVGDGSGTDLALRGETDPSQKVRMATIARVKFAADQLAHARSASLFANVANHYTPYFCLYKAIPALNEVLPRCIAETASDSSCIHTLGRLEQCRGRQSAGRRRGRKASTAARTGAVP